MDAINPAHGSVLRVNSPSLGIFSLRSHPLPFVPPGGRRYAGRTKEGWDRKVSDKEKLFIDLLVGRSYRLLTRSLHSSYVMWEGREEPA